MVAVYAGGGFCATDECFDFGVGCAGLDRAGQDRKDVDVFGESLDECECFGETRTALKNDLDLVGSCRSNRASKDFGDPEVLFDVRGRDADPVRDLVCEHVAVIDEPDCHAIPAISAMCVRTAGRASSFASSMRTSQRTPPVSMSSLMRGLDSFVAGFGDVRVAEDFEYGDFERAQFPLTSFVCARTKPYPGIRVRCLAG